MTMTSGQLPNTLAAMAVVIGLIWLAARLARFTGFGRSRPSIVGARLLDIQETLQLDRQRRLHRVRCGHQSFILLTGGPTDVVIPLASAAEIA